jgi:hypothetical protein
MIFVDMLNSKLEDDFGKGIIWDDENVPFAGFGLRYSYGSGFTFSTELSMAFGSVEMIADKFASVFLIDTGVAAGYIVYAGAVELHPRLGLGLSIRNVDVKPAMDEFVQDHPGLQWELSTAISFRFFGALTLRVPLSDAVALYAEGGFYAAGDQGPILDYEDKFNIGNKQPLLDSVYARFGAGLTLSF